MNKHIGRLLFRYFFQLNVVVGEAEGLAPSTEMVIFVHISVSVSILVPAILVPTERIFF